MTYRPKVQVHHVSYEPEIVTGLFKGEHYALTILNRYTKNISLGIIHCLLEWIEKRFDKFIDLDEENNETIVEDIVDFMKEKFNIENTLLEY